MKRLTKRYASHIAVVCDNCEEKGSYCDTSVCRDVMRNRLAEYEDAEEQGLLVRLPCKVGDTVWTINRGKQAIYEQVVTGFSINGESSSKNCIVTVYRGMAGMETYRKWRIQQFGKYVHSTREAAEKALEDA